MSQKSEWWWWWWVDSMRAEERAERLMIRLDADADAGG